MTRGADVAAGSAALGQVPRQVCTGMSAALARRTVPGCTSGALGGCHARATTQTRRSCDPAERSGSRSGPLTLAPAFGGSYGVHGSVKRADPREHLSDMNGHAQGAASAASTVELSGAGDEPAFARLVAAHHADMARVAYVVCGDRALAQDAVQSAWEIAWRKLGSVRDPERVRGWLVSVAANEARQIVRRRRRWQVLAIDVTVPADPATDPSAGLDRIDLARALAHLPADDRALLALRYVVGLDSDELGALTGRSASGVRARLCRLTRRLRKELRDA